MVNSQVAGLSSRFARTGAGRDWLHAYARRRIGRVCLIVESGILIIAITLLLVGFGAADPSPRRAVIVGIAGAVHAASCWIAWSYGLYEPEQADCGALIGKHSKLSRILVTAAILVPAQVLVTSLPAPQADNFYQIGNYLLAGGTILFTSAVLSPILIASQAVLVPTLVVGLAVLSQMLSGGPARADVWATSFLVAYVFVLKLRLTNWHEQLWRQWETDLDLLAELAAAEERLAIARDIHDTTGQTLSAIALKAELAHRLFEQSNPAAIREAREVSKLAREALTETRRLTVNYRTTDLPTEIASARALLGAMDVPMQIEGSAAFWPDAIRSVYGWVLREAVTNITRHANPTAVVVAISNQGGTAVLSVRNDGVETAGAKRSVVGGSGLNGLRERLAPIGGELTVKSSPGGFELIATSPFSAGGSEH